MRAMSMKPIRPSRNAATATSLAAFSTAGAVPPSRPASRASARQGKAASSGASKSRRRPTSSIGGPGGGGAGWRRAWPIGTFMSGGPQWASTLPSSRRTMAWTSDWGWTTTSMRS